MKNYLREGPLVDFVKKCKVPLSIQTKLVLLPRLLISVLFIYSGLSKLIQPIEYFQVAIGLYELFPDPILILVSHIVPWIELLYGVYLFLGYREKLATAALMTLAFMFQLVIGQALLRHIPLDECGCFGGGFIHLSLYQSFLLDTSIILLLNWINTLSPTIASLDRRKS